MMKCLCRIVALPFFTCLLLVSLLGALFRGMVLFVMYGGEWVQYDEECDRETVLGIVRNGLKRDIVHMQVSSDIVISDRGWEDF